MLTPTRLLSEGGAWAVLKLNDIEGNTIHVERPPLDR